MVAKEKSKKKKVNLLCVASNILSTVKKWYRSFYFQILHVLVLPNCIRCIKFDANFNHIILMSIIDWKFLMLYKIYLMSIA